MSAEEIQQRATKSGLVSDLIDSDLVVEVTSRTSRTTPDAGSVQRFQEAVEASYRALAGPVPIELETIAVLEELSKQCLSLWLRVHARGDGALAETSDASLLKFLARGTLAIIAWMDGSPTLQLADLQQAIRVLAWGTSITTTAHPVLPTSAELVKAIAAWQKAKASLPEGDRVRIVTNNGSGDLDLAKRIADPRTLLLARKLLNYSADMIFVVEMPDYKGSGEWRLKHGDTRTIATTEPGTLLDKFYRRELDVRPGDGLRCKVDFETSYGPDHEVLAERYRIVEIVEVLPAAKTDSDHPGTPPEKGRSSQPVRDLEPAAS